MANFPIEGQIAELGGTGGGKQIVFLRSKLEIYFSLAGLRRTLFFLRHRSRLSR